MTPAMDCRSAEWAAGRDRQQAASADTADNTRGNACCDNTRSNTCTSSIASSELRPSLATDTFFFHELRSALGHAEAERWLATASSPCTLSRTASPAGSGPTTPRNNTPVRVSVEMVEFLMVHRVRRSVEDDGKPLRFQI
jgi:hypothetical protein